MYAYLLVVYCKLPYLRGFARIRKHSGVNYTQQSSGKEFL